MKAIKQYSLHGYAGLVEQHKARETGTTISIYRNDQAQMDDYRPWSTVCEEHATIIVHETLALARYHAANPLGWCEVCNGQVCGRCGYLMSECECPDDAEKGRG